MLDGYGCFVTVVVDLCFRMICGLWLISYVEWLLLRGYLFSGYCIAVIGCGLINYDFGLLIMWCWLFVIRIWLLMVCILFGCCDWCCCLSVVNSVG